MEVKRLSHKTEFIALDIFKIICVLLVVSIHIPPFEDINPSLSIWMTQILARIAVPFFFVCSGFFLANNIYDSKKVLSYCKRIGLLYIIYTMLYLPQRIYAWVELDYSVLKSLLSFIRSFFLVGSYCQLWYFAGLIVATVLLYFSVVKLKLSDKKLIVLSGLLYFIGVCGNAYKSLFINIPVLKDILKIYYFIFNTTRNGIFFGFFLIAIGYLLNKHKDKILNKPRIYFLAAILSFVLMNIEDYFARYVTKQYGQDMIFTTPIVVTLLFVILCFINIPNKYMGVGLYCRKMSVLIFGFHLLIKFYLLKLLSYFVVLNSLQSYLTVVAANVILGALVIALQKNNKLKFLKYLY